MDHAEIISTKDVPFTLYFMCEHNDDKANKFLLSIDAQPEYMNAQFNSDIVNTYSYKLYDTNSLNDDDVDYNTVMEQAANKMSSILKGAAAYDIEKITAKQIGQIKTMLHDKQDETTSSKLNTNENKIRLALKEFSIEYGIDEPQQLQFLVSVRKAITNGVAVDYNFMQDHKLDPLELFDGSVIELLMDKADELALSINNTEEQEKISRPAP